MQFGPRLSIRACVPRLSASILGPQNPQRSCNSGCVGDPFSLGPWPRRQVRSQGVVYADQLPEFVTSVLSNPCCIITHYCGHRFRLDSSRLNGLPVNWRAIYKSAAAERANGDQRSRARAAYCSRKKMASLASSLAQTGALNPGYNRKVRTGKLFFSHILGNVQINDERSNVARDVNPSAVKQHAMRFSGLHIVVVVRPRNGRWVGLA